MTALIVDQEVPGSTPGASTNTFDNLLLASCRSECFVRSARNA